MNGITGCDRGRFRAVLAAAAIAFAPHLFHISPFVSVFLFSAWGYALGMQFRSWPTPPRWLLVVLALYCLGMVFSAYGRSFGEDAGVTLLMLMLGLKAVESKSLRDVLALSFLSYFVVVTNVLYSESLPMTAYMFFSVAAVTGALAYLHSGDASPCPALRRGMKILLQALPLAIFLFIFFPRLQGVLWGVYNDRGKGVSGFSDTLDPGSVSDLALSGEVAFRVDFAGPVPPVETLYWRGQVLDSFDGRVWSRKRPFRPVESVPGNKGSEYTVTLEPHSGKWIFALDLPAPVSRRGITLGEGQVLEAQIPLRFRVRYTMAVAPGPDRSAPPGAWAVKLPGGNPRSRDLARQWAGKPAREAVGAFLRLLREGDFSYTLSPGATGENDIVDHFLFASRTGYCEHYASAMAFVMRAAGIPARIVVGYQGGEVNPMGGYLLVRQSEAHAWVEVWMDGGWERVDPTSVIAPQRLTGGSGQFAPRAEGLLPAGGLKMFSSVFRFFRLGWDAANNSWNQWMLGFNYERQRGLWERLGLSSGSMGRVIAAVALGFGIFLTAVTWNSLRRPASRRDRTRELYLRFLSACAALGVPATRSDGPLTHLARFTARHPHLAEAAEPVVREYVALRYAGAERGEDLLEELVRAFTRRK